MKLGKTLRAVRNYVNVLAICSWCTMFASSFIKPKEKSRRVSVFVDMKHHCKKANVCSRSTAHGSCVSLSQAAVWLSVSVTLTPMTGG